MNEIKNNNSLKQELGLFSLTNIVIANMIGAGIFTLSGLLMKELQNPLLMIVLWAIGGIIALCGALCYGELSAAMPAAGGEYVFLSRLFHPSIGFLSGWVSLLVGFSAPIAASALALVEYLFQGLHLNFSGQISQGSLENIIVKKLCAIIIVVTFTVIHTRGIKTGSVVQNFLTILKIVLIVGLIFIGFSFGNGSFEHLFRKATTSLVSNKWESIGLSLLWIMFAYSGWNASSYLGSEGKKPTKNIPLSLFFGTGVVLILYLSINLLYVYATSKPGTEGNIAIGALISANLLGETAERVSSVLISLALFSSISAFILLGPRVYYAMAKDKNLFKFASYVHPRSHVPSKSIIFQGELAIILIVFGTFEQILTYMGFALGIFPIFAVLGVFKLRHSGIKPEKFSGYPITPVIYLIAGVFMLTMSFTQRPYESSIAIITVLVGIPFYFIFFNKKNSRNET